MRTLGAAPADRSRHRRGDALRRHRPAHLLPPTITATSAYTTPWGAIAAIDRQLHIALRARTQLQQAKGVLAEHGHLDMGQAFTVLRRYSRDHGRRLSEIAAAMMSRELPAHKVLGQDPP